MNPNKEGQENIKIRSNVLQINSLVRKKSSLSGDLTDKFNQNTSLFIKNINTECTAREFAKTFSGFNPVRQKLTVKDKEKFGFLEFKTYREARFCMENMNSRLVLGKKLFISELEHEHQKYFNLEAVVDDQDKSENPRLIVTPKSNSCNNSRDYSPGKNDRDHSDSFRGRSRSRSPRRLSCRISGIISPRDQRTLGKPKSPPSSNASSRIHTSLSNSGPHPVSLFSKGNPYKRQRTSSPEVEFGATTERRQAHNLCSTSYASEQDKNFQCYSEQDVRNDFRLSTDDGSNHKKSTEKRQLSDYLNMGKKEHHRQGSDAITFPPCTFPKGQPSGPHSAQDIEDAFKTKTISPPVISSLSESISKNIGSLATKSILFNQSLEPTAPKSGIISTAEPNFKVYEDIMPERSSSRNYKLQSLLLDLNFEYSTLETDLQKQQQIEKSAKQRQIFIEERRAVLREDISRLQSELMGHASSNDEFKEKDLWSRDVSASLSNRTSNISARQACASPVPVEIDLPSASVTTNTAKNGSKTLKRAAEVTITSNTRPMNPATILPRGSSASPVLSSPVVIDYSSHDVSFSSAHISFNIFSDNRRQVLRDPVTTKIGKTGRTNYKARSLVLYPSFYKARHSCIGLTSYPRGGGGIHAWNLDKKQSLQVIPAAELQLPQGYFDEIEWIERDCVAVAPFYKPENPAKYQLGLLRDCRMNRNDEFEYDFLALKNTPHQKGITAIIPLISNNPYSPVQMATGGLDHKIVLWSTPDITRADPRFTTTQLKPVHTSAISCLLHMRAKNTLYSGGKDAKIFGMDLETQKVVFGQEKRHLDQIQELLPIANHPDLFLAGVFKNNFLLYDVRQSISTPVKEIKRSMQSKFYHKASIHDNGMLLTSGNDEGGIEFWDLRYTKGYNSPSILHLHSKNVIASKFYGDELLSVSADLVFNSTTWKL